MSVDGVRAEPAPVHYAEPARVPPRRITDDVALDVLNRRFGDFDTAAKGGDADGKISRGDLQAVVEHSRDQELVDAASHLLDTPDLRDRLDTAAKGGERDGVISAKDLTSYTVREQPSALPTLATRQVDGSAQDPTVLHIDAVPPEGASWSNASGPRAGIVSVYVDGEYVADATIFAENPDGADVNLGVLGPGPHTIELRDSSALGTGAPEARIDPASVRMDATNLDVDSSDPAVRDQALAARYAPNLALADNEQATNNTPLMTTAQVIHHDDGTTTIAYRILYSNEDGGDGSDPAVLSNRWGRTTDDERVYEVTIDAGGEVIDFSGKNASSGAGGAILHDDDRGVREMNNALGPTGLPGIAISNEHNNVRWDDPGDRRNRGYSGVPVLVDAGPNTGRDASNEPGPATNEVMRENPWTWRVANAEMRREGADGGGSKLDAVQPYDRLYLSMDDGTFDEGTEITVHYANGQSETVRLDDANGNSNSVSVVLSGEPGSIASIEVAGAEGTGVEAYTLNGDDTPRPVTDIAERD
ncbi:hypothetical protein [Luteimonas aquatica]|uniref:hypothetical protein n=1 Tax=Luteimonas aquatica TaxID=450364 RepID=UPI001F57782A|nr:hypothetical protein [Luteimonas aquatica]